VIVPGKENMIFWPGAIPGRHREQRSRHSGDCAGKRKLDLLVWRQLWRVIESSDLVIQVILLEKRRSRQPEKFSCHTGVFEKFIF
jgi:hypothetical protein